MPAVARDDRRARDILARSGAVRILENGPTKSSESREIFPFVQQTYHFTTTHHYTFPANERVVDAKRAQNIKYARIGLFVSIRILSSFALKFEEDSNSISPTIGRFLADAHERALENIRAGSRMGKGVVWLEASIDLYIWALSKL